jgi:kynurenine formamidase
MTIVDLSVPLQEVTFDDEPRIRRIGHRRGAYWLGLALLPMGGLRRLPRNLVSILRHGLIGPRDFPSGEALAWEYFQGDTHTGTHLDAPFHFGSVVEGRPARTIDQVPLEWCIGRGVRLDLRRVPAGGEITPEDVDAALAEAGHELHAGDIVLIWTGAGERWNEPDYPHAHAGMGRDATLALLARGVRVIGIDAHTFDRPFASMIGDYQATHDPKALWPAHLAGREHEYCHLENLTNLGALPPTGFTVVCFPVKLRGGSAGWARAVALLEDETLPARDAA